MLNAARIGHGDGRVTENLILHRAGAVDKNGFQNLTL